MRNKKIIALVCAISMIFSVFASFTVVNAAVEKGIVLETVQKSKTEATITAKYVGFEGGINSANISMSIPEGATVTATTPLVSTVNSMPATGMPGASTPTKYVYGIMSVGDAKSEGDVIAVFTVTFDPLEKDTKVALVEGSMVSSSDGTKLQIADNTLPGASTTIFADPSKTPAPVFDGPAVDPDEPKPEVKDPVTVDKGIELTSELSKDKTTVTVTAKYVGFEGGINSANISMSIPEGATVTATTPLVSTVNSMPATGMPGASTPTKYVYGIMSVGDAKSEGDVIAVFTVTLPEPAGAEDIVFSLVDGSMVSSSDGTKLQVADKSLPAAWTMLAGTPFSKNEFALTDEEKGLDVSIVTGLEADENIEKVQVAYEATKNGKPAVYGTDFVAYYNGTALSEKQFNNYLAGQYGKLSEVLPYLTVQYNSGVAIKFQTQSVAKDGTVAVEDEAASAAGGKDPKPDEPKLPKWNITAPTSVKEGSVATVKPAVKNGVEGGTMFVTVMGDSLDYVKASGIKLNSTDDEDNTTTTKLETGVATAVAAGDTITFSGVYEDKNSKVVLKFEYKDADEADIIASETKTIKITEKSTPNDGPSGGNSNSTTGSMGPIAGPGGSIGTTIPGVSSFTDLGSVAWAQEAINVLASKGIINGRDAYTFDPNANITRAEYCQILVGAIGKTQEAADSSFADVASNAWYYHSVSVASQYGIVSGYGDGNFGPNNLITRQDMALMTMKAAQVMSKNLAAQRTLNFADAGQISDYALEAVTTLANAGIINGVSDTEFAPKANATRAQAAKILYDTFVK